MQERIQCPLGLGKLVCTPLLRVEKNQKRDQEEKGGGRSAADRQMFLQEWLWIYRGVGSSLLPCGLGLLTPAVTVTGGCWDMGHRTQT